MTAFEWSLLASAGAPSLGGLYALYAAWREPGRPFHVLAGWGLLLAGLGAGLIANGDRGLAQVCVIAMAGACAFFAVPMMRGIAPPVSAQRVREGAADASAARRSPLLAALSGVWTFLLSGPVAGIIALLASAGLFKALRAASVSIATAGASAIIAAVMLWALVSTLLLIEPRAGRRSLYAGAGLVLGFAVAFIPV